MRTTWRQTKSLRRRRILSVDACSHLAMIFNLTKLLGKMRFNCRLFKQITNLMTLKTIFYHRLEVSKVTEETNRKENGSWISTSNSLIVIKKTNITDAVLPYSRVNNYCACDHLFNKLTVPNSLKI